MSDFDTWLTSLPAVRDQAISEQAQQRQLQLTKPAGSLGKLEQIAIQLASMQGTVNPQINRVHISVYAADHGVMAEGVSAFPQSVTSAMIRNFAQGGAAISVMAKQLNAGLDVLNVGSVDSLEPINNVQDLRIAAGTANFCQQAAMTQVQCHQALLIGKNNVDSHHKAGVDIYIGGDMGIGNTTSATALACILLNLDPTSLAGPGTGLDEAGVKHKADVVEHALNTHRANCSTALKTLQYLGGFEIAALTGSYLASAKLGLPVLIDGYISSVAALVAEKICPGSKDWFLFSHYSAEPGHQLILEYLAAEPLLDLNMRLGEASGAAMAIPLLQMSCALHNNMATFEQADVAGVLV
ncbi:Nicotinate-nucleotide--dimethylbenzimidazole phosphoribosyltransferase [Methylophaga thiooxydans]|uniref:Nicotinate-nucleotide--dimethylbenzimidazole phosphoribosyltransferase n=1 Tax=Methylophaga thiooxydans TaxID=392484 RepID=A0A0A0BCW7_9GAMM|nr:nicotinate-nucleotide--dimethylbenzimidazole phosphoribosyltransferase [Methylophaga thiooxydans]KGM05766.1 Nicotinate-nucleotide--dimethylbenzimidazole phosphoribosyltransferase [Methylophaga thiooxydans]